MSHGRGIQEHFKVSVRVNGGGHDSTGDSRLEAGINAGKRDPYRRRSES